MITLKRGDSITLQIPVSLNGVAYDAAAATSLILTVKASLDAADSTAVIQKLNGQGLVGSLGSVAASLVYADTSILSTAIQYHIDVQAQDAAGVHTVFQDLLRVEGDVTRELVQSIPVVVVNPVDPVTLAAEVSARQSADVSLALGIAAVSSAALSHVTKDASGNTEPLNALFTRVNPTSIPHTEGALQWDPSDHTLNVHTEVSGVVIQVGQEMLVPCRNTSGATILNGKAVAVIGAVAARPAIQLATNTDDALAHKTIGVLTADLANNSNGYVTTQGMVRDINTSAWNEGDTLWLGVSGGLVNVAPTPPTHRIQVAKVLRSHITLGSLYVAVIHGVKADEVPLQSIAGFAATEVQGAVSVLVSADASLSTRISTDLAAESIARSSADGSLTSRVSAEEAARSSADAVLSIAISAEISRAQSVEAGKTNTNGNATFNTITTTGATVTGWLSIGNSTNAVELVLDGPVAADKLRRIKSGGVIAWTERVSTGTNLYSLQRHDAAGALVGNVLTISNATGIADFLNTLTVASSPVLTAKTYTTAQLLALTAAQSNAIKSTLCTDCYNLTGALTGGPVWWDGNASAGVWRLQEARVTVTQDRLTFFRGLAATRQAVGSASLRGLAVSSNDGKPHGLTTGGSGTTIYPANYGDVFTRYVTTAGGYVHRTVYTSALNRTSRVDYYYRGLISVNRIGTASDNAGALVGLVPNSQSVPASALAQQAVMVFDTQNGLGLLSAPQAGITFISSGGAATTETPTAIDMATARLLEIHTRGTAYIDFYLDGVLVASHSTNLPTGTLMFDELIKSTAYATLPTWMNTKDVYQAELRY